MIEVIFIVVLILILIIACVLLQQAKQISALRFRLFDLLTRVELLEKSRR